MKPGDFSARGYVPGNGIAQGIEAISFCPVMGRRAKDTGNI
jgi:hypothetical protein